MKEWREAVDALVSDAVANRRWYEAELHSEARAGIRVLRRYNYRGMPSVPGDVRLERLDVIERTQS